MNRNVSRKRRLRSKRGWKGKKRGGAARQCAKALPARVGVCVGGMVPEAREKNWRIAWKKSTDFCKPSGQQGTGPRDQYWVRFRGWCMHFVASANPWVGRHLHPEGELCVGGSGELTCEVGGHPIPPLPASYELRLKSWRLTSEYRVLS